MNGTVIVTWPRSGSTRAELLDRAEDVVPAAGVQRAAVVAQLVEDRVHLERRQDRLDQHGAADRAATGSRAPPRRARTPGPRARPRRGSRASGGRSTARCRARAARARCGRTRARSRRARPRPALAVDGARAARRGASRAAGRRASRSRRSARSASRASRARSCGAPRRGGSRCPSTTFVQVGEHASSKSHMKTRAPELSALIIILRSGGPVISQRRSRRSGGAGATFQPSPAPSR